MRVLLTGVAGFIGSNLLATLLEDSDVTELYALDDFSNGKVEFLQKSVGTLASDVKKVMYKLNFDFGKLKFREGRFTCVDTLFRPSGLFSCEIKSVYERIDTVIHLAAMPRVSLSVEKPMTSVDTNLSATLQLLDNILRVNPKIKFVFASSSAVYGKTPHGETGHSVGMQEQPMSPYGLHKLQIEQHLKLYSELYGLNSVSLRLFNAYGDNQVGGSSYSTALSAWLKLAREGKDLTLYGDGSHTRDLVHVSDIVRAFQLAMKYDVRGSHVFNIGCCENYTNLTLIDEVQKLFPNISVDKKPERLGDALSTLADIKETTQKLGWEPTISIREGIELTNNWYKQNWEWISKLNMNW
jgi:UDP-glucose 4-epimerase